MPITVTSDRPFVHATALALRQQHPEWTAAQAAERALRDFYRLSSSDGIWGGSEAAICMGYAGHSEDTDLFEQVAAAQAAEVQDREALTLARPHATHAPLWGNPGENSMHMKDWLVRVAREGSFVEIGQVSETSEPLARCAALSRYAVTEDDIAAGGVRPRGAAIYPDEDFEVSPLG